VTKEKSRTNICTKIASSSSIVLNQSIFTKNSANKLTMYETCSESKVYVKQKVSPAKVSTNKQQTLNIQIILIFFDLF